MLMCNNTSNYLPKNSIDPRREQMHEAAKDLEFEKAALLRDEITKLEKMMK
jgi:protein-arginine kinase activator protein McsA